MALTEREEKVLESVIEIYVETAKPVGSKAVSEYLNGRMSPATVRNLMFDLEEQGYLYKPYSVSGRIPTSKAFRHYVNTKGVLRSPGKREIQVITSFIKPSYSYIEEVMIDASRALSAISRYAGIVVEPKLKEMRFKGIEIVKLSRTSLLILFITTSGLVYKRIINYDEEIDSSLLESMKRYLNENFEGLTFKELRERIIEDMRRDEEEFGVLINKIRDSIDSLISSSETREVYIEGTSKIIGIPEFTDVMRLRELFKTLEQKERLLDLLDRCLEQNDLVVIVGEECEIKEMRGMGIIASPFGISEMTSGVLGIIGPLRMDYPKLIPLVSYTAKVLTRCLSGM